jgi:23S rRNA pseudouridine1911/1915/1917 synthase
VAKPNYIELPDGEPMPILHEDRSALAVDKPRGWMLAPGSWRETSRNLQAFLDASVGAREFWARSRNLRFIRFVHRLDAETTGVLLLAKSPGAVAAYSELFESREMEKRYLAIVRGVPVEREWTCRLPLARQTGEKVRMVVDARNGKEAETQFRVLKTAAGQTVVEARPLTGRTHQIRVHLAQAGCPVVGDALYGRAAPKTPLALGLRSVFLAYTDPFRDRRVEIRASADDFLREYGFDTAGL